MGSVWHSASHTTALHAACTYRSVSGWDDVLCAEGCTLIHIMKGQLCYGGGHTIEKATIGSALDAAAMTSGSWEKSCGSQVRPSRMAAAVRMPMPEPICSSRFRYCRASCFCPCSSACPTQHHKQCCRTRKHHHCSTAEMTAAASVLSPGGCHSTDAATPASSASAPTKGRKLVA